MSDQSVVNIFGLLEGKPQLPRMTLWTPGNIETDGTAITEPLTIAEAGRDFLTQFAEAEVAFPEGFSIAWVVETQRRNWLMRRTITVSLRAEDPRFRLVSTMTHRVVPELCFGQDLAIAVFEACNGDPRQYSWWLR